MKKRILTLLLALCLLPVMALTALATEAAPTEAPTEVTRAPDECGEGITWAFSGGVLTITGDGAMDDFEENAAPWQAHKDEIEEVIIEGDLTYIGAYAFKDYDNLLAVTFGDALYEIGTEAFASCDGLVSIWMPKSFKIFGERSFQSCKGLEEIHCSGRPLTFKDNSMWQTYVTIYYPAERPWGIDYIRQMEENHHGRLQFIASDGTDHYEPTEAPTEPEETVPETTAPPETVPPTETEPPVTEAPATEMPTEATAPETEPETVPETEAPPAEEHPTEAPEKPESKSGIPTGLVIVGAVLLGVFLGFVLFGRKKGKYAR